MASPPRCIGSVKWYDPDRRFGFIVADRGQEVFFHKSNLQQYGLREHELVKGTPVLFKSEVKPGRRPEVIAISLA
jgi:cold shock CspA family protein